MISSDRINRPSEEDALDRAIHSIDPLLKASLQREQKQRRRRLVIAGGIVMAALLVVAFVGVIFVGGGTGVAVGDEGTEKVERIERADTLKAAGWQVWQTRPAEAETKFRKALKLDPKSSGAWNGLGWACMRQQKFEEAIAAFSKCLKLAPQHGGARNGLGQTYLANGDYRKAEVEFLQATNSSAAWYGLVRLYLLQERFEDAQPFLKRLKSAPGIDKSTLEEFAAAVAAKKVSDELRTKIAPVEKETVEVSDIDALVANGWKHFGQGRNRPAEASFRAALKIDRKDQRATNGLAFALLNQGNAEDAKPLFERLLAWTPDHAGAQNGLARCLQAEGKTKEAVELWKKLDARMKTVSAATSGLATTYFQQGKYEEALPYLEKINASGHANDYFKQLYKEAKEKAGK